jgi:hypothetical protein
MERRMLVVAALLLAAACANQPKTVLPRPLIRTIAIIPATNPATFSLANVSAVQFVIPLAATVNYFDSKSKAAIFNEKLSAQPSSLAERFTADAAKALRAHGYQVEVLEGVVRPPDDPDNVDYDKLVTTADAVLQIRLTEVGLYSPLSSNRYLPRVNTQANLFVKGRSDYLYDQEILYGVDARSGNAWAIEADPKVGS